MTVCIAAICPVLNRIICVADAMISSEYIGRDGAFKFQQIADHDSVWLVMFAGHAPRFQPIIKRARKRLRGGDLDDILEACEYAHRAELQHRIEMEVLLPYGISREEFIQNGKTWFDEATYGVLMSRIHEMDVGLDILVAGYDSRCDPHMFEISAAGITSRIDQLGYHAIGAGLFSAMATLNPLGGFLYGKNLAAILYRLLAAKFAAESTPGVGRDTIVLLIGPKGERAMMLPPTVDRVRDVWLTDGQPPIPSKAEDIIAKATANAFPASAVPGAEQL